MDPLRVELATYRADVMNLRRSVSSKIHLLLEKVPKTYLKLRCQTLVRAYSVHAVRVWVITYKGEQFEKAVQFIRPF